MNTPREVKSRFPYMFDGPNIGITIYRGWLQRCAEVCIEVDAFLGSNKRNFHWTQTNEKFGAARRYWASGIEERTPQICFVCGREPAKLDAYGCYLLNLCAHHAKQHLAGALECPWYPE